MIEISIKLRMSSETLLLIIQFLLSLLYNKSLTYFTVFSGVLLAGSSEIKLDMQSSLN